MPVVDNTGFAWVHLGGLPSLRCLRTHDGAVLRIHLHRPHRLNALNKEMLRDLGLVFEALATPQGAEVRAVVIAGDGKGFCSGADLKAATGGDGPEHAWDSRLIHNQRAFSRLVAKIRACPQLVVAAINGPCVGGGFAMALACDVRFARSDAVLYGNFPQLGLSACELGVSHTLPRLVGIGRTLLPRWHVADTAPALACCLQTCVSLHCDSV